MVDLKLMADGKIKIFEFGRGFVSAFTGYDQLNPDETVDDVLRLPLSMMKPNCINYKYGTEEEILEFFKSKQSSAQSKINTKKFN